MAFNDTEQVVLTTLLYSDIFDFPLTEDELWHYLIARKPLTKKACMKAIRDLLHKKMIVRKDSFLCLQKREQVIDKRKDNLSEVSQKILLAHTVAHKLSLIPTVLFIGISGGLAAGNATEQDDIDFFIITQEGTLYTTRLVVLTLLESMGLRRSRDMKHAANKICVNLLIDETQLTWTKEKRDIYTAREIAQLIPLFQREDMYFQFVHANSWITTFLPNWQPDRTKKIADKNKRKNEIRLMLQLFGIESFLQLLQKTYMKKHQTTEHIENQFLAFHPNDYRSKTLSKLRLKCKQLGLLTKF
jgi:hypothetical protein